jgi:uncharacterized membrane protein
MKLREHQWLAQRLQAWTSAGLLSPSQSEAVQAFEDEQRRRRAVNPALITGLFAALCVALGAILIVSHNWQSIPDAVKQVAYLALTALLLWGRGRLQDGPAAQALDVGLVLWPLAGIGLWAQVYQLSGDPSRPLLTAAALALPVVWKGNSPVAAVLQCLLAAMGLFMAVHLGGGFAHHALATRFHWEMQLLAAAWLLLLIVGRQRLPERFRSLLLAGFLVWLYSLVMLHGFRLRHQSCHYMAAAGSVLLFWGTVRFMRVGQARAEADGSFWLGLLLYIGSFGWWGRDWMHGIEVCPELLAFPFVISALGVGALLLAPMPWLAKAWGGERLFKGLMLMALVPGLVIAFTLNSQGPEAARLLINVGLAAMAVYWMLSGVARGEAAVVNRGMAWLALLLVTRFLDVFSSLLSSGLGFMLGGLVLGALAWGLHRARKRLLAAAGGRP